MPNLAIALTEGFADWEAALLMATARAHLGVVVTTATPGGTRVTSMGGLVVVPDGDLGALDPAATEALVLPGGTAWESATPPDPTATLTAFRAAGRTVGAICAATRALARAGLLDDVAHTSNAADVLAATGYAGAERYRAVPHAVSDGGIVTAPGTAPVSFALEILRALGLGSSDLDGYAGLFAAEHRAEHRAA